MCVCVCVCTLVIKLVSLCKTPPKRPILLWWTKTLFSSPKFIKGVFPLFFFSSSFVDVEKKKTPPFGGEKKKASHPFEKFSSSSSSSRAPPPLTEEEVFIPPEKGTTFFSTFFDDKSVQTDRHDQRPSDKDAKVLRIRSTTKKKRSPKNRPFSRKFDFNNKGRRLIVTMR